MEDTRQAPTSDLRIERKERLLLFTIVALAAFLRLWQIREFAIFLGDEGRDALVVKRMIVDGRWTLLGPTASVGGFYLGPVYYYLMIPFLWMFGFDPVGPAVMVAIFGIASVLLLYVMLRRWMNRTAAAVGSLLYASAPGVVAASRSSWNPNIMPFFSLLMFFSLERAITTHQAIWYITSGAAFGIAIQSHYLGLILGPILALATLVSLPWRKWFKAAIFELVGFVIGASLFIAFEIRHGFPNTRSIIEFVGRGSNTTGPRSWNIPWLLYEMLRRTFESVLFPSDALIRALLMLAVIGTTLALLRQRRKRSSLSSGMLLTVVWLVVGLLGIGAYRGQLYPHYFGYLFPLPFVLLGIAGAAWYTTRTLRLLVIGATILVVTLNLWNQKIWGHGSNLIDQTKQVSLEIASLTGDAPFNLALIGNGNSDHAYRYFLEIMGRHPRTLEEEVSEQLIVICENPNTPCQPLGHPLWEIAGFGRAEIVQEISVPPGIRIIKLTHHPESLDLIGKPAPKGE